MYNNNINNRAISSDHYISNFKFKKSQINNINQKKC